MPGSNQITPALPCFLHFHGLIKNFNACPLQILKLNQGELRAAAKRPGEFETNLREKVLDKLEEQNAVLFIDNLHDLVPDPGAMVSACRKGSGFRVRP